MRLNFILLLVVIIKLIYCHKQSKVVHECDHDSIQNPQLTEEDIERINRKISKRMLQSVEPQPFRVTYDASQLSNSLNGDGMTEQKKNYILKIMDAAVLFLKKFIKVIPRTKPLKSVNYFNDSCGNGDFIVKYPDQLKYSGSGIPNSDLHLLVTFQNLPSSGAVASAGFCELDPGPIIGRVRFNIANLQTDVDHVQFYDNFAISLHELTHVLGFSSDAVQIWRDPETQQQYNLSQVLVNETLPSSKTAYKIKTKNIVKTAQKHYNCESIDGMYFENQGGSGSKGSHWERDLLSNEYMTASAVPNISVISEFTAALLRDTGFYAEINSNMVDEIQWGKEKGCEFFKNTCNSSTKFDEFGYEDNLTQGKCVQNGLGGGYISKTQDKFSECQQSFMYINGFCEEKSNSKDYDQFYRQKYGPGSKCFNSSLMQIGYGSQSIQFRCFQYKCSSDFKTIDVYFWENEYVTCKTPSEVIDVELYSTTSYGPIECPSNFKQFCSSPKFCKNFCSSNGICVKGQCLCLNGYAGEDCSIKCESPNVYDGNNCIQKCVSGTYKNPDNTCKTTCPNGHYKDSVKNECIICHRFCSSCTGPTSNECQSCNFGYDFSGSSCNVSCHISCKTCNGGEQNNCKSCSDTKYLDSSNYCQPCSLNCKTCTNNTKCSVCLPNYQLDPNTQQCIPNCHTSCKICSKPYSQNSCSSCNDGYYLDGTTCKACISPCKLCSSASKCLSCISTTDYIFNSSINQCDPICDSSCKTCSIPKNSSSCTACNNGYQLNSSKQCIQCQSPCKTCDKSAQSCLSCINNSDYVLNIQKQSCDLLCHQSCKTCTKANDSTSCTTCSDGFYFEDNICKQCKSPCKKCVTSQSQCTECEDSFELSQNQCIPSCDKSCATCSKLQDKNACLTCKNGYVKIGSECKRCNSPCQECENTQTQCKTCITNFKLNGNVCEPSCHYTCDTCSQVLFENKCTSCQPGYYLDTLGVGKCIQCKSPCKTCVSELVCDTCVDGYKYDYKIGCLMNCDSSCETCSSPNDKNQCLSCKSPLVLIGNSCQNCQDGEYYENKKCFSCDQTCKKCSKKNECTECNPGYYLNEKNQCISEITCHATCNECINSEYSSCSSCAGNRNLKVIKDYYGICECPSGTLDLNEQNCSSSNTQQNVKMASTITFVASVSSVSILSLVTANPALLLSLLEFSQNISYLRYVNQKQPLGFDQVTGIMSYSHFTEFAKPESIESQVSQRILLQEQQSLNDQQDKTEGKQENFKLILSNKSHHFLFNAFFIIIIQSLSWIMSFIFFYLNKKFNLNSIKLINKIFFLSVPIVLFVVCSQEVWLLIIYQIQTLKYDSTLDITSLIFCFLTALYMLSFLGYLFYKLEYKRCIKQNILITSNSELNKNTEHSQSELDPKHISDSEKFYIISLYVKQKSFMTRNIIQIIVLQKLVISCVIVFLADAPLIQIYTIISCNITMALYLGIFRPLKLVKHTIFLLILYIIEAFIAWLYSISLNFQDDSQISMYFSLIMMSIMILVLIMFSSYSILITIKQIHSYFRKNTTKKEKCIQIYVNEKINNLQNHNLQTDNNYLKQSTISNSLKLQQT